MLLFVFFMDCWEGAKSAGKLYYEFLLRVPFKSSWAYSSVGLERSPDKGKVSGSNPLRPTIHMLN